jgi:hypothetical protein
MKAITGARYLLAASLFVAASSVLAEDFKTLNGKEYKFSGGIVKIPFTPLSPELQEKYHYDSAAAASYRVAQRFAQEQAEQQQRAAAEDAARKRAADEGIYPFVGGPLETARITQLNLLAKTQGFTGYQEQNRLERGDVKTIADIRNRLAAGRTPDTRVPGQYNRQGVFLGPLAEERPPGVYLTPQKKVLPGAVKFVGDIYQPYRNTGLTSVAVLGLSS